MKLDVAHLTFAYRQHAVLNDVSFCAQSGDFLSVLGPNGVGKSTLFRCILNILQGYMGDITVDGQDVRSIPQRELAGLIAYIPQLHRPTFGYTVFDTVLMGTTHRISPFMMPKPEHFAQVRNAMQRVGIEGLAERNFARLSGGEQQLVLVARAIAQQSKILVMDEPTSSLDFGNQLQVLQRVRELADAGYTVLLSTHNPQHALTFSSRILALSHGKVATLGAPETVLTPELVSELYGVRADFVQTRQGRVIVPFR